ncbi:MAG: hypothetical protein D6690_11390 [Nitrospirae bacterium]|nr:MAG: hypothetical protein D6690_11390 [Nitrospirota bacterium]
MEICNVRVMMLLDVGWPKTRAAYWGKGEAQSNDTKDASEGDVASQSMSKGVQWCNNQSNP